MTYFKTVRSLENFISDIKEWMTNKQRDGKHTIIALHIHDYIVYLAITRADCMKTNTREVFNGNKQTS